MHLGFNCFRLKRTSLNYQHHLTVQLIIKVKQIKFFTLLWWTKTNDKFFPNIERRKISHFETTWSVEKIVEKSAIENVESSVRQVLTGFMKVKGFTELFLKYELLVTFFFSQRILHELSRLHVFFTLTLLSSVSTCLRLSSLYVDLSFCFLFWVLVFGLFGDIRLIKVGGWVKCITLD